MNKTNLATLALLAAMSLDVAAQTAGALKPPAAFDNIADPAARSAAVFIEAGKVITHPRCLNCHPNGRRPTQGNNLQLHEPYIHAGVAGRGQPGLSCTACHQAKNVDMDGAKFRSVPGNGHWSLAPESMAWQNKSIKEICQQLKDPARNGGRSLAQIVEHMGTDGLVGWAWDPGTGREPAPGTQKEFGKLIESWVALGAACP